MTNKSSAKMISMMKLLSKTLKTARFRDRQFYRCVLNRVALITITSKITSYLCAKLLRRK